MSDPTITMDEWLQAIRIPACPEGFNTANEIAGKSGYSVRRTRERLVEMVRNGEVEERRIGNRVYYRLIK